MTTGILFIVDCLRYDAFPSCFLLEHKGRLSKFESALNTPLAFNSILLGRNLSKELPINEGTMLKLYTKKPKGEPLYIPLRMNGVNCYFFSDHSCVQNLTWWSKNGFTVTKSTIRDLQKPWFLMWHTFHLHGPQAVNKFYRGNLKQRQTLHKKYAAKVEHVFKNMIEPLVRALQPDHYVIMGDHGEEFWDDMAWDSEVKVVGHGSFKQPITTDNVRYTALFTNSRKKIVDYETLYSMMLGWYKR